MEEVNKYSFNRGWEQRRAMDAQLMKKELMEVFGIVSEPSWCVRKNGKITPKIDEYVKVTAIFNKYGITKIWGEETEKIVEN